MLKRIFDFIFAIIGLLFLAPLFIIIAILIKIESKGPGLYKQLRVGRNNLDFKILKFRTMHINADQLGLLTLGHRDTRITKIGYYLRKYNGYIKAFIMCLPHIILSTIQMLLCSFVDFNKAKYK